MIRLSVVLAMLAVPAAAEPVAVGPCDETAGAWNLVEPWDKTTAVYGDGAVRIALIDTVEPAGAPMHLMVISPPLDELGLRQCRLVSLARGSGFFGLDFAGRKADYQPGRGLTLTLPAKRHDPATGDGVPATLRVTINQQTGAIDAALN